MIYLEIAFVGISMGISLTHIFGPDIITWHFAIFALSVSGLIEFYRNLKMK